MKNIVFVIAYLALMYSCSKEEILSPPNHNFLNPPHWIIGIWMDKNPQTWSRIGGFEFTNDNMKDLSVDGLVLIDYKTSFEPSIRTGQMSVEEEISDTSYEFRILSNGAVNSHFKFSKISDNSIKYHLSNSIDVELRKQ